MPFRKGEVWLYLFTTIATFGTPQDVTLQELRVACFFPIDRHGRSLTRDGAHGGGLRAVSGGGTATHSSCRPRALPRVC